MALIIKKDKTPIRVDGTASAKTLVISRNVEILWIYWYQPTTVAHLLEITDGDGHPIALGYCENANESQWFPIKARYNDIYINDMDSGTVLIYLG